MDTDTHCGDVKSINLLPKPLHTTKRVFALQYPIISRQW